MGQNKRYYWLKLHEEFFRQAAIKYLRTLPDGEKITIIYLKLLLISLRTDGYIYLEGLYPSVEEEIALILDEQKTTVQFSLAALEKVNLLECGYNEGEIHMTRLPDMIGVGSETATAQRVRASRSRKAIVNDQQGVTMLHQCNTAVTSMKQDCYAEKELELDTEKRAEQEERVECSKQTALGVCHNVDLSYEELASLKRQFPADYMDKIDYLSSYMEKTGRNYESHFLTILQWAKEDARKQPAKSVLKPTFEDYSCGEDESY